MPITPYGIFQFYEITYEDYKIDLLGVNHYNDLLAIKEAIADMNMMPKNLVSVKDLRIVIYRSLLLYYGWANNEELEIAPEDLYPSVAQTIMNMHTPLDMEPDNLAIPF